MKNITKVLIAVVALLTTALQSDVVQGMVSSVLAAHPKVSAFILGLSGILALIHAPKQQ